MVPGGFKLPRDFLHAQQLGPFAQILGIAYGDRAFAAAPWNDLDGNAASGTGETAQAAQEKRRNAPTRNMGKAALRQSVIARTCLASAGTDAFAASAGFALDFYSWIFGPGQPDVAVDKM